MPLNTLLTDEALGRALESVGRPFSGQEPKDATSVRVKVAGADHAAFVSALRDFRVTAQDGFVSGAVVLTIRRRRA